MVRTSKRNISKWQSIPSNKMFWIQKIHLRRRLLDDDDQQRHRGTKNARSLDQPAGRQHNSDLQHGVQPAEVLLGAGTRLAGVADDEHGRGGRRRQNHRGVGRRVQSGARLHGQSLGHGTGHQVRR